MTNWQDEILKGHEGEDSVFNQLNRKLDREDLLDRIIYRLFYSLSSDNRYEVNVAIFRSVKDCEHIKSLTIQ